MNILEGVRIVEIADEIAGPYCGKLFVDVGGDVIKVEPPGGDRFRRRGTGRRADDDGALFKFLNAGKRSAIGVYGEAHVDDLIAGADIVIDSGACGGIDHDQLLDLSPDLVIVVMSPFGLTGPCRDKPATEFTLQAESGTMGLRARPDQPPLQAGGRVFEWVLGSYAAVGALAAFLRARAGGGGEVIDCSLLEACHLSASGFIDLYYALAGSPPISGPARMTELPSIEPTADGWVGFNTNTRQQFESFLLMIEREDLLEQDAAWALASTRYERMEEWNKIVHDWTTRHTTDEIVELASQLRIPVAQVNNGQTVLDHPHFNARGVWSISADGSYTHPLPPYRIAGMRPGSTPKAAPRLGEHDAADFATNPRESHIRQPDGSLPLAGIRVIDATAWWAGPSSTHILAALGADVIHLESIQHPDGARMTAAPFVDQPNWWERSAMFLATNTNKRGLTLDLSAPKGRELFFRLIEQVDLVVENFSPRVFENFGITWEALSAVNSRLIMTRMPAFGLDGPWRNNVGFAQTMEQMTGMAWVTGHEYDQPRIPRGPCDPLAGMHSAFAMLVGLSRREHTGQGSFIEVSMVEAALNAASEQAIEYTAYGTVLSRLGNRSRDAAPQGLYPCRGEEEWLALSIASDEQWSALKTVLGRPGWANDPSLDTHEGRWHAHDLIDAQLEQWASGQKSAEAAAVLSACGVPASALCDARLSPRHPQLVARGYFEQLDHSIVGPHQVPTLPFRFRGVDRWCRSPAPTVGEHNEIILTGVLGLDESAIEALTAESVIGTRLKGMD
ncbi:CoA transferase [Mycobacterium sp. HNNTM2301]|uniref:CaiB/BaiF CoA-transferase family protein n=1 Tax=Mycobacterium hainanense TaxID=3289775 RepID=UPI0035A6B4AD